MHWSFRCVALLSVALLPHVAIAADGFVTIGKVQLHYVQQGAGNPIVLLHGRGGDIGTWLDSGVFDSLAKGHRVVAVDLRGHGKSGKPHDPKQYGREMGLDIVRLLDHLGINQAHIVGYSLGSAVVTHLLTIHPDRFLTATLVGGAGRLSWTAEDAKRTEQEASEIERYGVSPTTIRRLAPPNEPKPTEAEIKKRSEAALANHSLDHHAIAAVLRSYGEQVVTPAQAASVRVPTLAIIGGLDPFLASVQELKTLRPGLKMVVVDNATHGGERGVIRRPEFVSALREFLDTHSPASTATRGQATTSGQESAQKRAPIIDVHLHAQQLWTSPRADAGGTFGSVFAEPITGILAAESTAELQRATLAALERYNIVKAVASGGLAEEYRKAQPGRILASPLLSGADEPAASLRVAFASGRYQALAEFMPQYSGLAPNDPSLDAYFALAEELDVPVGIHVGLGPPGAAYAGSPKYRMAHSNPLLLEDVLVRHPKLRLYVMHAGWPMLDEMVGLLYAHPQVYVDVGVIDWFLPQPEFYSYLRRLVEAGFSKRIMFGSDQMVWPDAIGRAVVTVESAPFLSEEQRRDIMCRNAMRFLRLDKSLCE